MKEMFIFKDEIVEREIMEIPSRFSPSGVIDKDGNVNPPLVIRSVFSDNKFIESFEFDSIADPDNKVMVGFHKKYGQT